MLLIYIYIIIYIYIDLSGSHYQSVSKQIHVFKQVQPIYN